MRKSVCFKKFLILTAALILMMLCVPLGVQAQSVGDVNNDGTIDAVDALQVIRHAVRQKTLNSDQYAIADVTKNNAINSADALEILQYSVGRIDSFDTVTVNDYGTTEYTILKKGSWGVDVSDWQPSDINWTTAKNAGVSFAFLRTSYGWPTCPRATGEQDENFETYYTNARAAGVQVGVYHYSWARSTDEAIAEANYVLSILNGRDLDLPVVFDIENSYQSALGKATYTAMCVAFCKTIEAAGYDAMIYSYYSMLESVLDFSQVDAYDIWMAHFADTTDFPYRYDIWQYSSSAVVSGMGSGNIDVSRLMRDFTIIKDTTLETSAVTEDVQATVTVIESEAPAPESEDTSEPVGENVMGSWRNE